METDLQLAKTIKLRKNTEQRVTRSNFCDIAFHCNVTSHCFKEIWQDSKFFSFKTFYLSIIYRSGINIRATLKFINAHLQQRDQVATKLRTVDFWLIVCGDTCVLTVAPK